MYTFLLILLVLDSIALVAAILLQSGKGQGLAASFGGASSSADAFIGMRQAGNLLTKASWWCGGVFLFLAFVLQIMSTRGANTPRSVLDGRVNSPAQTAPAPATNGASALPLTPVPATPAAPTPKPAKP